MKLWLDDLRIPPQGWTWVKTATDAIAALKTGQITDISLDHDLGDDIAFGTGYLVAKFIEESAFNRTLAPLMWSVHSANPVGVEKMRWALQNADKFWAGEL